MAVAVTLIDATPTTHLSVTGVVVEGVQIEPRDRQFKANKFWGVVGESQIDGKVGGRNIILPVLIYDDAAESPVFETARLLADYIDYTLNTVARGKVGTLTWISEADHSPLEDCVFEGAMLTEGPKHDEAGTLGGGYFAMCLLAFRELGIAPPPEPEEP